MSSQTLKTRAVSVHELPNDRTLASFLPREQLSNKRHTQHPLHYLLDDPAPIAKLERALLSAPLVRLQSTQQTAWLASYLEQLIRGSANSRSGFAFEALCYDLLSRNNNNTNITPAPPKHAGHDISLRQNNTRLNVSCKYLQVSAQTSAIRKLASQLSTELSHSHFESVASLVITSCTFDNIPSLGAIKLSLRQAISQGDTHVQYAGCDIHIQLKPCATKEAAFSATTVSINVEQQPDEEVRLQKLFRKAAANITQHTSAKANPACNAVFIGLPTHIPLDDAEIWISNQLAHYGGKVSYIVLIQTLPYVTDEHYPMAKIETRLVTNPHFQHTDQATFLPLLSPHEHLFVLDQQVKHSGQPLLTKPSITTNQWHLQHFRIL
ncbi:MAG: hypothetical protein ACPGPF_04350 [Pontibacterium sp.]